MPSTRCQDTRRDATSRTARESSTPEENSLAGSNARLGTLQVVTAVLGLAAIAVYRASAAVADPDLWQQISLFREALELGSVPLRDHFAYTPTVVPSVHHEWLAGAIAYAIVSTLGGSGIAALRYLLLFGLGALVWQVNRAQQVGFGEFAICALLGLLLMDGAFSTVRPQMYAFVLLASLCDGLERDRRGDRRWLAVWLVLYVAWLNLHASFAMGAGLFFLHWLERWLRGEPHRHLLAAGIAMVPLTLLTPFHVHLLGYLYTALTIDRSHFAEWGPLLATREPALIGAYLGSLALLVYAVAVRGWSLRGVPIVLAAAAWGLTSRRMVHLYGVVWLCLVPAYLSATPIGAHLRRLWDRRALQLGFWGAALLLFTLGLLPAEPWRLRVPGQLDPRLRQTHMVYPIGAVDYLRDQRFAGNLLVGFDWGAYVSWKLHPHVLVSMDSRFEVAYPPEIEAEQFAFWSAEPGWQHLLELERYRATDLILAPRFLASQIHAKLAALAGWKRVYRDRTFELFAREGSPLPVVDRPDVALEGTLP
jgi:hypothetical protein